MSSQAGSDGKKRVLILSADAGFGHKAAANAIAAAFSADFEDQAEVTIVNPLDHTNAPRLLVSAQDDYDRMIQNSPDLYRVGYEASDGAVPAGLAEQALTPQGEAVMAFYNPPWTLPLLRRNEILVKIQSVE